MKSRTTAVAFGLAAIGLLCGISILSGSIATDDSQAASIQQTLQQRLDVLREVVALRRAAYESGQAGINSLLGAESAVLEAELELAKTAAERIAARERMLSQAQERENAAASLVEAGEAPMVDHLMAKAYRLRAEADLLIERERAP